MSGPERRRLARIPLGCAVVVREKVATWIAETADVGARGCRLVTTRPIVKGALVQLRFEGGDEAAPLEAVGQVVWTRSGERLEAGIAFVSAPRSATAAATWMDALAVGQLRRAALAGSSPGDLGYLRDVVLRLGAPPRGALTASALAVVKIALREGRVAEVQGGGEGLETLAALLADGTLTLGEARGDAQAWKRALSLPPAAAAPAQPRAAAAKPALTPPPLPRLAVVRPRLEDAALAPPALPGARASHVAALIEESLGEGDEGAAGEGARVA